MYQRLKINLSNYNKIYQNRYQNWLSFQNITNSIKSSFFGWDDFYFSFIIRLQVIIASLITRIPFNSNTTFIQNQAFGQTVVVVTGLRLEIIQDISRHQNLFSIKCFFHAVALKISKWISSINMNISLFRDFNVTFSTWFKLLIPLEDILGNS